MREKRTSQVSIFEVFSSHELGRELEAMSAWLDENKVVCDWVARDLGGPTRKATGRKGVSAECVLRCALLKQHRQLSYQELAFHLQDSASFQAFARLPATGAPKKSALQQLVSAISAQTWERINGVLTASARRQRVEPARRIRIDSTAIDAPVHKPSDSSLLYDAVRVMVRLLKAGDALAGAPVLKYVNHSRVAKKRARSIMYARGASKRQHLYAQLLQVTCSTLDSLNRAYRYWHAQAGYDLHVRGWMLEVEDFKPLIEQVISQTERRVLRAESVPVSDKLVSLFEPHTDIIVKGTRDTHYGHKLNLVSGRSGLILDVVVESGNPADAERFMPLLERHQQTYACMPRQVSADGGYASADNVRAAKARGVVDVAFHKKRGLAIEDMVKNHWTYRRLRNFRAGIEANISCLKRAYGLDRCTWKGLPHFESYVWSSVLAYNLSVFTRHVLS